ncbi:DUF3313 domain-containing protein [Desulfovibrio sulfodismutans]|uniref:DUF3313 domain-containing protein n=1 Tax=Desulfolutivibrio sulfodismutans TaxID=63561 RepID=A0A7K3NH17_9BACT|nr:DUF3313 domain-containing protein [Desulfolutivibrio sulfodismutans]NDY55468.1 DUF3313 domain-containing protein [Desulfolutivibrio sulfodismutans]QLA12856.1 DUF3313 family protein [Desulfolutivibrio sulfodismutans DSM 3696]
MTISRRCGYLVCLTLVFALAAGCKSMKAKPSEGAGFVPMSQMSSREDLPFQKVWVKSGVDWKAYNKLYIAKVNTAYLMNSSWWQQSVRSADMQKDVSQVAAYMREAFQKAFAADPQNRFKIVDAPTPDSLTLELAMTELVPSHVVMEALSLVAPYGSGVAVQAAAKESDAKCTVAFEAKILASADKQVLAMAADREQGKFAPINLNALTWYGEAHVIIDEWAGQFVQIANRRPGEAVKDSSPFTLSPW